MSPGSLAGTARSVLPGNGDAGTRYANAEHVRLMVSGAHEHDILTTAEGSARLGVFVDFVRAAGLADLLHGDGPFTVLAPTERAFLKLSLRERDALLAEPLRLSRVMRGHVIAGKVLPPMTDAPHPVTTIDGKPLVLTTQDGTSCVGNVRIVQANITASNGIIHAIDSVLL